MAGLDRLVGTVCLLLAFGAASSCRGASAPADAARTENTRTTPPARLEVGDAAPQFSLPASDGHVYSLSDYRGKQAVVLAWFVKAFTGP